VDHKFGEDLKQKIVELTKVNVQLKEQVSDFMRLIATTQQERDTFRDETKDLTEQKNKLIAQNTILTSSYKEKCVRLD
jgi:tRNA C32,U32 (ribose-2'-O)-methylase TrmJ